MISGSDLRDPAWDTQLYSVMESIGSGSLNFAGLISKALSDDEDGAAQDSSDDCAS